MHGFKIYVQGLFDSGLRFRDRDFVGSRSRAVRLPGFRASHVWISGCEERGAFSQ